MIALRTFGQVEISAGEGGNGDAVVASSKRLALFCYLALPKPGALHRRDTLLGMFWPDVDQEHARMSLRQALAFLRRKLGEGVLIRCGDEEVGLNPDMVSCDVATFQGAIDERKWEDALEMYRGEFLKGFFLSNDREFDRWLSAERSRLERCYAGALEHAAQESQEADDLRQALEYCERLVEHDPYNSRYAVMLMRAFTACGDPANALLYAERHATLLQADLNVQPPAGFDTEVQQIRAKLSPVSGTDLTNPQSNEVHVSARDEVPPAEDRKQSPPGPARSTLAVKVVMALALVVMILGGGLGVLQGGRGILSSGTSRPTVVVMPLETLGPADDSVFAAGLTGAITTRLAEIHEIGVVSGWGAQQEDQSEPIHRRLARDLGVDYVLAGTVQHEPQADPPGRVMVNLRLTHASDGVIAWSGAFATASADIFSVYGEIGAEVAEALNVSLLEPERIALVEQPTENAQAYEYYLLGNAYFDEGWPIRWELRLAADMYERAIAADSEFALAYARLSLVDQRGPEARLADAEEALRLEPGLPEGHLALGWYHYRNQDFERALNEFEIARDGLANDYWYLYSTAAVTRRMGRFPEAASNLASASELRPLAWSPALEAGQTYRVLRQFDQARRYLDRYIAIQPNWPFGYLRKALTYLEERGDVETAFEALNPGSRAPSYDALIAAAAWDFCMPGWFRLLRVMCGDCRESIELMQTGVPGGTKDWHYYLGNGLLYDRIGDGRHKQIYYDSAATILEGLLEENPDVMHYHSDLGMAYAALGRRDDAVREVRTTVSLVDAANTHDYWAFYGPYRKLAEVYATFGEADSATAQLEYLFSELVAGEQSGNHVSAMVSVPFMRIDPVWDPIRDYPPFQEMLERYEYLWRE